jgi:FtsZ-binding cell division protein ZapB
MTPEQIARVVDTVAELRAEIDRLTKIAQTACDETFKKQAIISELRADNERLRGVIRRNCDPFSATPPDAEIINEVCALEAKP